MADCLWIVAFRKSLTHVWSASPYLLNKWMILLRVGFSVRSSWRMQTSFFHFSLVPARHCLRSGRCVQGNIQHRNVVKWGIPFLPVCDWVGTSVIHGIAQAVSLWSWQDFGESKGNVRGTHFIRMKLPWLLAVVWLLDSCLILLPHFLPSRGAHLLA